MRLPVCAVIIAGFTTTTPRSSLLAVEGPPENVDWKAELQQVFGASAVVEEGELFFFLEADCQPAIEKYGSCFGNNPASPYGMYDLGDFTGPADRFR